MNSRQKSAQRQHQQDDGPARDPLHDVDLSGHALLLPDVRLPADQSLLELAGGHQHRPVAEQADRDQGPGLGQDQHQVLGRPGLGLDIRELLIVAMLVVQGESGRRQLRSHLQGALNAGVAPKHVEETIRHAAVYAPLQHLELAIKLWSLVNGKN